MIRIGLDAKRAIENSTGLGNFSRKYIEDLLRIRPEAEYLLLYKGKQYVGTPSNYKQSEIHPEVKLDIVHGLSNYFKRDIYKSTYKQARKVLTVHDVLFKDFPENYSRIDSALYDYKMRKSLAYADTVVCITQATKEAVLKHYSKHLREMPLVIRQGIDSSIWKHDSIETNDKMPYIVCVGTIEARKNQLRLIQAYNMSSIAGAYKLVLVGRLRGEYGRKVKALIEDNPNIELLHSLNNVELAQIVKHATASVYASVGEGFGLPVLESIAIGTPVATSNISAIQEAGGQCAIYFDPYSVESISQALELVVNPYAKQMLDRNVEAHMLQFNAQTIIDRYWSLAYKL